jgi:predicted nucleotidyltransferase
MTTTAPDLDDVIAILKRRRPAAEYRAFLFGSRASGESQSSSDWDIGILGPEPLRGAVLETIRGDLEDLPTLHSFDVVDLAAVSAEFRRAALSHATPLG